ncbi:ATP synthase subunit delta, partial [Durusdinium trenchii]
QLMPPWPLTVAALVLGSGLRTHLGANSLRRGHLPRRAGESAGKESHLAQLRRKYRWSVEELLQQCRTNDGTQTCVLLDEPLHAANVGSILRQAAVLQSPTQPDGVSAVLLSRTAANARAAEAIFSEKFLKNVLRISLAERQALEHATRLVILPTGPLEPLKQLRQQGFVLLALENLEACLPLRDHGRRPLRKTASSPVPLWCCKALAAPRVVFVAGGEAQSLRRDVLELCDWQCYIPAASCPLVGDIQDEQTHNPTLNLAHAVVIALYERRRQLALGPSHA